MIYVHRATFEMVNGPIPAGAVICHTCDQSLCCNPDHLFLGNQSVNVQDAIRKGRWPSGEGHPSHILTQEQTFFIKRHCQPKHPEFGPTALARRFGVSYSTIQNVYRGEKWRGSITLKSGDADHE
jgi:hypothetical protein